MSEVAKESSGLNSTGRIPAGQPCPFRADCAIAQDGDCHHKGAEHPVPYSCALARGFALIRRMGR